MEGIEQITYDKLEKMGVSYVKYEHEPLYTIAQAAELDKEMGIAISKNLFLSSRHQSEFFLLFMKGGKKFNTGKVSKQLGVPRMTFADDEHMMEFLKILPGAVSPLGLLYDSGKRVKFLIDSEILSQEKIAIHPCVNTATLVMNTQDLLNIVLPFCGHENYQVIELENRDDDK